MRDEAPLTGGNLELLTPLKGGEKKHPEKINGWSEKKKLNQMKRNIYHLKQTSGGLGNRMLIFQGVLYCVFFFGAVFFGYSPYVP